MVDIMNKTIRQKTAKYVKETELDKNTYTGDIETCYECAYLQAESDLITKLWETEQFTMSKIAEMLDKRLMEVRNAINNKEWY